jgi:hypothetical protein
MLVLCLLCAGRLVVTEVMANPAGTSGTHSPEDRNEYVEICNSGDEAVDLFDWRLTDGDAEDRLVAWSDSSLLAGAPNVIIRQTWLQPGRYAVVLDSEYTDLAPEGGHVRPYRFGDSCLALTVRNTTLGDGLTTNDPVTLYSLYGDTTTFGTPDQPDDGFPDNTGDGISWERINTDGPDIVGNWAPCPAAAGCTPGAANSTSTVPNLAVTDLGLAHPEGLRPGQAFACSVTVANAAFAGTDSWELFVFLDANANAEPDHGEPQQRFEGWVIPAGRDSTVSVSLICPQVTTDLWALVVCPRDEDSTNDRRRLAVNPAGVSRALNLVNASFSPDDDGFEDTLAVVYRLPRTGGKLAVTVFDLGGRVVRRLHDAAPADKQGLVQWDGLDESGMPAATGIYAVWLDYHAPDTDITEKLPAILKR